MATTHIQRAHRTMAPRSDQVTDRSDRASELLAKLVVSAALAPSSHNTQPWRFNIHSSDLELFADRSRRLQLADPFGRELIMSCGAALQNIRLALRHYGYAGEVELFPDGIRGDLLARVRPGDRHAPSVLDDMLFAAIVNRHTNRERFHSLAPQASLIPALRQAAEMEGAWIETVRDGAQRMVIAELVAEGDRVQGADPAIRREIAAWVHRNGSGRPDGIPAHALGVPHLLSLVGPMVVRYAPWGSSQAKRDRALALEAPVLIVLGTTADTPRDWLAAGQALQHMLLVATTQGVSAAFLNQPVQVADLRSRLRAAVDVPGVPQLVIRMGYGPDAQPTPRRAMRDALA